MTVRTGSTHDVFLSHASEDKADVVLPLAELLERRGVSVWLDQQQLQLGDSLSKKIDEGLAQSRFGVVVLSPAFLDKQWPERELSGLVARETTLGIKVILPVWHNVTPEQIAEYSPPLAGKLTARTDVGLEAIADQIAAVLASPTTDAGQVVSTHGTATTDAPSSRGEPDQAGSEIGPGVLNDEVRALIRARDEVGLDEFLRTEHREWARALDAMTAYRQEQPKDGAIRSVWEDLSVAVERRSATLLPVGLYDVPRFQTQVRAMARTLELRPRQDGYAAWAEMAELATTCVGYIVGSWLLADDKLDGVAALLNSTWDEYGRNERLIWLPGEAQSVVGRAMASQPSSGGQWLSPFWEYFKGLLSTMTWYVERYPEVAETSETVAAALSTFDLLVCLHAVFGGDDGAVAWFDLAHPSHGATGPVLFARRLVNDTVLCERVARALGVDGEAFRSKAADAVLEPHGWQRHFSDRDTISTALSRL